MIQLQALARAIRKQPINVGQGALLSLVQIIQDRPGRPNRLVVGRALDEPEPLQAGGAKCLLRAWIDVPLENAQAGRRVIIIRSFARRGRCSSSSLTRHSAGAIRAS